MSFDYIKYVRHNRLLKENFGGYVDLAPINNPIAEAANSEYDDIQKFITNGKAKGESDTNFEVGDIVKVKEDAKNDRFYEVLASEEKDYYIALYDVDKAQNYAYIVFVDKDDISNTVSADAYAGVELDKVEHDKAGKEAVLNAVKSGAKVKKSPSLSRDDMMKAAMGGIKDTPGVKSISEDDMQEAQANLSDLDKMVNRFALTVQTKMNYQGGLKEALQQIASSASKLSKTIPDVDTDAQELMFQMP